MGVYVFQSRHGPWIKVGHHRITSRRPNVYYRIAGRGFYSCLHPRELQGRLSIDDFDLVAWYPHLGRRDERAMHRACSTPPSFGEFHALSNLELALRCGDARGERQPVDDDDRRQAVEWASRTRGA